MPQSKTLMKSSHRDLMTSESTMMREATLKQVIKPVKWIDKHIVSLVDPGSYEAEQYRKLRYRIEELHKSDTETNTGFVVGVCSPVMGEGKSITAMNLAGALARNPQARVLLLDADLRRKSETIKGSLRLKNRNKAGLVDVILDRDLTFRNVIRPAPPFFLNLDVVHTGETRTLPYEILRSARFGEFIKIARRLYDYVILDTPPVVPVADCRIISKHVDTFLMVVSANQTSRAMLGQALDAMNPNKLLGLVFNRDEKMSSKYYKYFK